MSRVLPILFNTEMVRAILDGRKTVTRRVIKFPDGQTGRLPESGARDHIFYPCGIKYPPYQPGDTMYVRETWKIVDYLDKLSLKFEYEADGKISDFIDFTSNRLQKFLKYINKKGWCPALFMPKEAARIWLKLTNVRVERLQEITDEGILKEGLDGVVFEDDEEGLPIIAKSRFIRLWNSTLKKSDLGRYGWDVNPWVWVIEFERCEKPEREE